jgi:tRNA1(Val) A37 N6-methylase TrmN6
MQNLHKEPLGGGMEIFVTDSYHFTTDTILLAHFSNRRGGRRRIDLGAGCGTIGLLWLKENRSLEVTAVEIQTDACELLSQSVRLNGLGQHLSILNADLRELRGRLPFGTFDMVACNPPYKLCGTGVPNPEDKKLLARHETACTLNDICTAASNLLQFGGRFCLCQRPERLPDVMEAMRAASVEPKTLRLVQQRRDKAPKLFLMEGRKGGKRGYMETLPTLFIENDEGDFSDEMRRIYGNYKSDHEETL